MDDIRHGSVLVGAALILVGIIIREVRERRERADEGPVTTPDWTTHLEDALGDGFLSEHLAGQYNGWFLVSAPQGFNEAQYAVFRQLEEQGWAWRHPAEGGLAEGGLAYEGIAFWLCPPGTGAPALPPRPDRLVDPDSVAGLQFDPRIPDAVAAQIFTPHLDIQGDDEPETAPEPPLEEAQAKAKTLLAEHLSRDQLTMLFVHDYFEVQSQHGHTYRLLLQTTYNVLRLDDDGQPQTKLCVVSQESVPLGDQLLMQKALLETDEDRFLATANSDPVELEQAIHPMARAPLLSALDGDNIGPVPNAFSFTVPEHVAVRADLPTPTWEQEMIAHARNLDIEVEITEMRHQEAKRCTFRYRNQPPGSPLYSLRWTQEVSNELLVNLRNPNGFARDLVDRAVTELQEAG